MVRTAPGIALILLLSLALAGGCVGKLQEGDDDNSEGDDDGADDDTGDDDTGDDDTAWLAYGFSFEDDVLLDNGSLVDSFDSGVGPYSNNNQASNATITTNQTGKCAIDWSSQVNTDLAFPRRCTS